MGSMEDLKQIIKMIFIYNALEMGWTVRKLGRPYNTFEFLRTSNNVSLNPQRGELFRVRRSNSEPICNR